MGQVSSLELLLEPGGLESVFQPVFELGGKRPRIHYLEALTRGPQDTNLRTAGVLFEYVRRKGRAAEIDRLCIAAALRTAARVDPTPPLGLNVHASTLERDFEFVEFLLSGAASHGLAPERIVLEIVEHAPRWSGPRFAEALAALRSAGVRLALDDVGLGQSNYRMLLECRPDYLKLDAFILKDCHLDSGRVAVIESLLLLARRLGAQVIAEGIEQPDELETARGLGVGLVQGYLLAKPAPITQMERWTDAEG